MLIIQPEEEMLKRVGSIIKQFINVLSFILFFKKKKKHFKYILIFILG